MTPKPLPWSAPSPLPIRRETPRLLLRYFEPTDAESLVAALDEDRASFMPWLPWVPIDNRTIVEAHFNIERFRRERIDGPKDNFVIGIIDRATGHVVGGTGLHRMNLATHEAEIGYWTRPSRRGQGLCTEATEHLIDWAFAPQAAGGWGLRRLQIYCAARNHASRRVPEKLNLRRESDRRADRWLDGIGWSDTLGWGVTADERSDRTRS
ncbi:MAG: GNAT family protein [Phycisphaerae bacterium]|nr:GNAT family protein [Phycisphaerae bacterium]